LTENEDVIRRAYEAFNRRDFEALRDICDREVAWRWGRHFFESDIHGVKALRRFFERWIETFPDVQVELEDTVGDGDRLLVLLRQAGAAGVSGVPSDMEFAQIITLRSAKILDVRNYTDRREARSAYDDQTSDASGRI